MAIRHGLVASAAALPPTVSLSAASNFNQELATLNATVSANGYSTTVKFQYSTASNFSSYTEVNAATTPITGQDVALYANITGLSNNTTYYFRCVATNDAGTTTSSSLSFTTWALQVYERTTSGGTTFTIPTVTPTGGSTITVSIYDVIMFGGGGGSDLAGGGGGGYVSAASITLSGNRSITTSVGAAGANISSNPATAGGATTITGDITTQTAGGGNVGSQSTGGGTSGSSNAGGTNQSYDYAPGDKLGWVNNAGGGGGGAGGTGANGSANSSGTYGGNGGTGVSITRGGVTVGGGAGGGGGASAFDGGPYGAGARGSNNQYGSGGTGNTIDGNGAEPQGGYMRFRYYAASALA